MEVFVRYTLEQVLQLTHVPEVRIVFSHKVKASDRLKVHSSSDMFDILWPYMNKDEDIDQVESFYIIVLNRNNGVLGIKQISKGGVAGTTADVKVMFSYALHCLGSAIILAHNHPSGNIKPSDADIRLTKKVKEGGKLLDIDMLDHLIITPERKYYSFADEGAI